MESILTIGAVVLAVAAAVIAGRIALGFFLLWWKPDRRGRR